MTCILEIESPVDASTTNWHCYVICYISGEVNVNTTYYFWNRWSSCRKAREVLLQKGIDFDERDFFKEPFSKAEILLLLNGRDPDFIFSWKSPSFKKLGLDRSNLTSDDLISLMIDEARLIKRPLIQIGNTLIVGADWKALDSAFDSWYMKEDRNTLMVKPHSASNIYMIGLELIINECH